MKSPPRFPVDPVIEAYKRGVDLSLLRENLRRSPEERLLAMVSMLELSAALADGMRQTRRRGA